MTGVLVDSSVVIDLALRDGPWRWWSATALRRARAGGRIFINQVIYAESITAYLDAGDSRLEDPRLFEQQDLPWKAAAMAGQAHAAYRRRGGSREAILPDFLIGAHAAVEGLALLTRDPRRVQAAFPDVRLITPDE